MKGFAALLVIVVIVVILAVFLGVGSFFRGNRPPHFVQEPDQQGPAPSGVRQGHQEESEGGYGMKKPFYSKDGVLFQHYWPGDGSFSNEETEILIINESNARVQITSYDMAYAIDGKSYSQKSGTWEKFPSKQSWDRIEYLNISPQYYKGEPLILEVGQKGKLHWHLNLSQPLPQKAIHTFQVKLSWALGGVVQSLDQKLEGEVTLRTGSQGSH